MTFKSHLIRLHRLTGLLLVLPILLISLSGSFLVFDHAIDEWLNPEIMLSQPGLNSQPLTNVIDSIMKAEPGITDIVSLSVPRHERGVYLARVAFKPGHPDLGKRIEVMVDPYTANVTGIREWGTYFTSFIYRFHFTLLAGRKGEVLLGLLALILLINLALGAYLGWPKSRAAWAWLANKQRKASRAVGQYRRLHISIGLVVIPFLCILSITGLSMIFPDVTASLLTRPALPPFSHHAPVPKLSTGLGEADRWVQALSVQRPGVRWMRLRKESRFDRDAVKFTVNMPGDPRRWSGSSAIWIDRQTGQILAEQPLNKLSWRQQLRFWLFPLHSGEAAGLMGRLLVFFTGVLTAGMATAGLMLWLRRRAKSRNVQPALVTESGLQQEYAYES